MILLRLSRTYSTWEIQVSVAVRCFCRVILKMELYQSSLVPFRVVSSSYLIILLRFIVPTT